MDKMGHAGPSGCGGMLMWPQRVYSRKKRAGLKGKGKEQGLRKITEKEEWSRPRASSLQLPRRVSVTRGESLQENSPGKETPDEKITPLSESVTNDYKTDSCSSSSELVSGLTLEPDASSCLLSYSDTESFTKSTDESVDSYPSPELFRGADCLDWEHPWLEEYTSHKNSTLLETSRAVAVEKVPQFANLSAILSSSSENYEKCHRKIGMTLETQNISPEPKYTLNLPSVFPQNFMQMPLRKDRTHAISQGNFGKDQENAASELIFAEKTGPLTTKKTKKKPEKESEDRFRGPRVPTKLSSGVLGGKALLSPHSSALDIAVRNVLLPQPLEHILKKSSILPDNQSKALLTSTPSSDTADFVVDLSPVQNVSFEELFPNVSNYVNSSEILPVLSWQESSSNEFPSNTSEICCIIRASPGTRRMKNKDAAVKKRCSLPKDVPLDIIMKTNART